ERPRPEAERPRKDATLSHRLIDSKRLFSGPIFDVERDHLRDDSGYDFLRDIVRHPGGAGGLPLFDDGRVALVSQYRHPARRTLLEIPAGRIEPGETAEQCAAREIEAEVGSRPGKLTKVAEFFSTPGFCEEKLHVYLATELTPSSQSLDPDEIVEIVYLPVREAIDLARTGQIEDSKTIITLLLVADLI
ncbi:MAG: NUDIX hydrolase, partial [Acidobacteriota bacterium]